MLSNALADINDDATREFTLKPEQEVAVRALLDGKDVLAVLPTGYGKSLIYQIQDIKSIGYSAVNIREFSVSRKFTSVTLKLCLLVLRKSRKRLLGSEFIATSEYLCYCSGRFVIADRILCSENY